MTPNAISTSLFVEGSHGEALKRTVVKSLVVIFSLLVPAAAVLYLCGGWVLGVVGAEYAAGGAGVLQVMVGASLFVGVNSVYFAIKRVQRDVRGLVVLSGVVFGLLVGFGYVFMLMFGVVGSGMRGWLGMGLGACVWG
jgi:O-antigen/teichoic acid export membrane protein